MQTTEREPWVNYLEGDVLLGEVKGLGRVYQVVIRIQLSGLMAIVKVRGSGGFFVKFMGATTLPSLAAKIRESRQEGVGGWKEDKYPPT